MAKVIPEDLRDQAEDQIKKHQKEISYDTKDFTVELLVQKFSKGDFYIPDYQRAFIWKEKNKSLFIESVLLGLPIPFLFFADNPDGKLEIIDGAQRIQTLHGFINGDFRLLKLPKLTKLKGFRFSDLKLSQQRRFLNRALRIVVLDQSTPKEIRQDIFNRINTTGQKAKDSEIRRGSYPGSLTNFIEKCTQNHKFIKLCPLTQERENRRERFELVLRFFAYVNSYLEFNHLVKDFLDVFLIKNMESFNEEQYNSEFERMLDFVEENFPFGFAKSISDKRTPRVRFEAISVGVALALREKSDLKIKDVNFIYSDDFKSVTTTDASNNATKLKKRIEFVRDHLLNNSVS